MLTRVQQEIIYKFSIKKYFCKIFLRNKISTTFSAVWNFLWHIEVNVKAEVLYTIMP